jgi:protein-tyrosine phosphatase
LIDLHCHLLPGLDDGPADIDETISLARFAAADGTRTIVATPHVREDYPFDLGLIAERAQQVNDRLARASLGVTVEQGAEVAVSMLRVLDDTTLATICLGASNSVLVESPYQQATDLLEQALFDLQLRGFRPVLAHPERSPSFMGDPDRLAALVDRGVLCSVTSASMAGRFGRTVQRFSRLLFERGLVHDVASDAHDVERRSPGLTAGFRLLGRDVPGLLEQMDWYTSTAPAAILAGGRLPARPSLQPARRRFPGQRSRRGSG